MLETIEYLSKKPHLCAGLSAGAIADAGYHLYIGSPDWFIPTGLAFFFALLIQKRG